MNRIPMLCALLCGAGVVHADIVDDFESYTPGGLPGGIWQDATSYIDAPTHTGNSVSVIDTTDAFGNATRAAQINDHVGTSGGLISNVGQANTQRFEIDVRLDQRGNGSSPNWMSAVGFFQDTDQTDFNWSPQAVVYASAGGRFRLFVQNADGRGGASRDFGLNGGVYSLDTWYRIALEADTINGVFDVTITDLASGSVIADATRTYAGWNASLGQYDLISVNDGEYGNNPGTIGNMSTYDNARYIPAPGAIGVIGIGAMTMTRRKR